MKTGVFIGRFQPFHDGHKKCIEKILEECDICMVLVRDGVENVKNPYTFEERRQMIEDAFPEEYKFKVLVNSIFDRDYDLTVYRGREVGWNLEDIKLDPETEAISATKIRNAKSDLANG